MPTVLREPNADTNPVLAGGVYGDYITLGRPYYWVYDGSKVRFILLIAEGGKYGLDSIDFIEYNGVAVSDYIFHRGTITKQLSPKTVQSINTGTDVITANTHGLNNDDPVRFGVINGVLPPEISANEKYYVRDKTTNTFKIASTVGSSAIDLTNAGSNIIVWKADAGFDDLNQGLPTYCPEVETTFSNRAYIEGKLNITEQPDWTKFRIAGVGRRLMDYDADGNELGIITGKVNLRNIGLQILDNLLVNQKIKNSRIHFTSWRALREASDVQIWQTPTENSNTVPLAGAFTARYYSDTTLTNLVATTTESLIDFDFGTSSPIAGMPTTYYSIAFEGKISPNFTEVYTFELLVDDFAKVYLDENLILEATTFGTFTVSLSLTANQIYDLRVEYGQTLSVGYITLKWSSASQTSQKIPAVSLDAQTLSVARYANAMASPELVEASEYHERLMERAVGWDWTDNNGKIEFLPPDRPIAFAFKYDAIDDDSKANFVQGTFTKKHRRLNTRKNFELFKYRVLQLFGFPISWVQGDRPEIRRFQNSTPNNNPSTDLGVMTRSLAERIAEMQMKIKADPKDTASIEGLRGSSKIRKNHFITVSYFDTDGNFVEDDTFKVNLHSWGTKEGKNGFDLLPITQPYYTDEELVVYEEEEPSDLVATWDSGEHKGHIVWVNNHALGSNIIERQIDGGSWEEVATLAFNVSEWFDTTITLNGNYNYRVKNTNVPAYSNEDDYDVSSESTPSANKPTDLSLTVTDGVVTPTWINHGGTGDNKIQRKPASGGSWTIVGTVASGVATFDDEGITLDGDYTYRVYNESEVGYTNEETITVDVPDGGGGETGLYPIDFGITSSFGGALITAHWTNRGASGDNVVEISYLGSYIPVNTAGASDTTMFLDLTGYPADYYLFRIYNTSCGGYSPASFVWSGE